MKTKLLLLLIAANLVFSCGITPPPPDNMEIDYGFLSVAFNVQNPAPFCPKEIVLSKIVLCALEMDQHFDHMGEAQATIWREMEQYLRTTEIVPTDRNNSGEIDTWDATEENALYGFQCWFESQYEGVDIKFKQVIATGDDGVSWKVDKFRECGTAKSFKAEPG